MKHFRKKEHRSGTGLPGGRHKRHLGSWVRNDQRNGAGTGRLGYRTIQLNSLSCWDNQFDLGTGILNITLQHKVCMRSHTWLLRWVTHIGSLLPPRYIEAQAWGNLWKWVSVQRFRTRCITTKWPSPTLSWMPQCWPQLLLSQNNTQVHIKYNCVLRFFFVFFYPQKQFLREFHTGSCWWPWGSIPTYHPSHAEWRMDNNALS
jgi:hypothetical protein